MVSNMGSISPGDRFGRLTVINRAPSRSDHAYWSCACDCGSTVIVRSSSLTGGKTSSCGCVRADLSRDRITDRNRTAQGNRTAQLARTAPNANNTSGYRGVTARKTGYAARVIVNGRYIYLGTYDDPEEASRVYADAKQNLGGLQNDI